MITSIILNALELQDIITAVCEYNGLRPQGLQFLGSDGKPIEVLACSVVCESRPLQVRVAEDEQDQLKQMTAELGKVLQNG